MNDKPREAYGSLLRIAQFRSIDVSATNIVPPVKHDKRFSKIPKTHILKTLGTFPEMHRETSKSF